MTTPNQNNAGVANYMQEQANQAASERWATVMSSDAAKGRENLAIKLLSIPAPNAMLPGAIIAVLEKAPLPSAASPAPVVEPQEQPAADVGPRSGPGGVFDPVLIKAGADAARFLLNKPKE